MSAHRQIVTEELINNIFANDPEAKKDLPVGVFTKLIGQDVKSSLDTLHVTKVSEAGRKQKESRVKELEALRKLIKGLKNVYLGSHIAPYLSFLHDAKASTTSHPPIKKVVIVGAGISALAAARELVKKGIEVVFVEGRDYVGGRLHTVDGLDLGGHWIHGGGPDPQLELKELPLDETNPIRKLCDEFGIETILTDGNSTYVGEGEIRKIQFFDSDFTPLSEEKLDILWSGFDNALKNIADSVDLVFQQKQESKYLKHDLEKAFKKYEASLKLTEFEKLAINWHKETQFGSDYAEDTERHSFLYFQGLDVGHYQSFKGGDRALRDGYTALIDKLAEPLLKQINLNDKAVKISHGVRKDGDHFVIVKTKSGKEYEGDAALITVPLGVLKRKAGEKGHIDFSPDLPKEKQEVIDRMKMACLNKVFLEFDQCYWPQDQYTFAYVNKVKDEFPSLLLNMYASHKVPILALLSGGAGGRAMALRSEEENLAWALPFLSKLFGRDFPRPKKYTATCWQNDPFAFGSYSCANVGINSTDMSHLGFPVDNRLFFAGEATQPLYWGCVHGAYLSGLREAARITGDWSLLPSEQKTVDKNTLVSYVRSHKVYKALKKKSPQDLRKVFKEFDVNKDGILSPAELREGFFKLGLNLPLGDATILHDSFDSNQDGSISVEEFGIFFKPQP